MREENVNRKPDEPVQNRVNMIEENGEPRLSRRKRRELVEHLRACDSEPSDDGMFDEEDPMQSSEYEDLTDDFDDDMKQENFRPVDHRVRKGKGAHGTLWQRILYEVGILDDSEEETYEHSTSRSRAEDRRPSRTAKEPYKPDFFTRLFRWMGIEDDPEEEAEPRRATQSCEEDREKTEQPARWKRGSLLDRYFRYIDAEEEEEYGSTVHEEKMAEQDETEDDNVVPFPSEREELEDAEKVTYDDHSLLGLLRTDWKVYNQNTIGYFLLLMEEGEATGEGESEHSPLGFGTLLFLALICMKKALDRVIPYVAIVSFMILLYYLSLLQSVA